MFPNCSLILCSSSVERDRRARWATYFTSISTADMGRVKREVWGVRRYSSLFVELAVHEGFNLGQGLRGVMAVGVDGDCAARTGGQHHQAHDAFAVDLLAVLFHEDVAAKAVGGFDKHGRGPGMNAQLVRDLKIFGHYGTATGYHLRAHSIFRVQLPE